MEINNKIKTSLFLSSYLDTLGFNNTVWEFNWNNKIKSLPSSNIIWLNIIHHYYSLGGKNIDLSGWTSSDDTILNIIISEGCLNGGNFDDYYKSFKKYYEILNQPSRQAGVNTIKNLKKIFKIKKLEKMDYNKFYGGNGAAIRTAPIGLIYYKEKDIDKLIENSILSSRITHNYALGFLGGLVTALFTSYAINNINVLEWCDKLLELYESGKINDYMKKTNIYEKYNEDKNLFFDLWYQYREKRLKGYPQKISDNYSLTLNRLENIEIYFPELKIGEKDYSKLGQSGIGAVILAYDSLLNSLYYDKNKKEHIISFDSMIFFSTLHFGDNDSTGAIAGAWYGALYGTEFENNLFDKFKQLEFYEEINKISKKIIDEN